MEFNNIYDRIKENTREKLLSQVPVKLNPPSFETCEQIHSSVSGSFEESCNFLASLKSWQNPEAAELSTKLWYLLKMKLWKELSVFIIICSMNHSSRMHVQLKGGEPDQSLGVNYHDENFNKIIISFH